MKSKEFEVNLYLIKENNVFFFFTIYQYYLTHMTH